MKVAGAFFVGGRLSALVPNRGIASRMKHCQHHDSKIFDNVEDEEREVADSHSPDMCKHRCGPVRRFCYQSQRLLNALYKSVTDAGRARFIPLRRISVFRPCSAPENNGKIHLLPRGGSTDFLTSSSGMTSCGLAS